MSKFKSSSSLEAASTNSMVADQATNRLNSHRETVESIVVAVILAFLFRAFVAEAFVIPTGSMAPTLQGRHKDVECAQCGYPYRAGASCENADSRSPGTVVATQCPVCRYTMSIDGTNSYHDSFTGDRILVSKFDFDIGQPERWDVIVFKFPQNAKQNYIKRLVGLPGETIRIWRGDIFVEQPQHSQPQNSQYRIVRKPDHKLRAMLQLVDDTNYIAEALARSQWPSRWQPWPFDAEAQTTRRLSGDDMDGMRIEPTGDSESWLRYHHTVPRPDRYLDGAQGDWHYIEQRQPAPDLEAYRGQLITDFYEYNAFSKDNGPGGFTTTSRTNGLHWVGDLALEAEDVTIEGSVGECMLDLVEGGVRFTCRIDVATGTATLSISDERIPFVNEQGETLGTTPTAETKVRGNKTYDFRFANVDDELSLWINDKRITFDNPTTYFVSDSHRENLNPTTNPTDPTDLGDLAPLGIGATGVSLDIPRLRVLRDVYYIASNHDDYIVHSPADVWQTIENPNDWNETDLFKELAPATYSIPDNEFFPLGDNSPQSSDARFWHGQFVPRELMIGKALLIYWPHAWYPVDLLPILPIPNCPRMGLIQ